MTSQSSSEYQMNFVDGKYHPNNVVNEIICKAKREEVSTVQGVRKMISDIEKVIGSRGCWETQEVVSKFPKKKEGLDQLIFEYFALPFLKPFPTAEEAANITKENQDIIVQHEVYNNPTPEQPTRDSKHAVRKIIEKYVYRSTIFLSDTKEVLEAPNFVRRGNTEEEVIPQCVMITDIILTHLQKKDYSLSQKINWWLGHKKTISDIMSRKRSTSVYQMQSNFLAQYQKDYNARSNADTLDSPSPFSRLCDICTNNDSFVSPDLLDLNVNMDVYRMFLDLCASSFFRQGYFENLMKRQLLSQVLTVSEEAFALLSLENNFKRWEWIAEPRRHTGEDATAGGLLEHLNAPPPLKYQKNIQENKNGSRKKATEQLKMTAGRWTNAGMSRMNDLIELVEEARKDRESFEKALQEMYIVNCSSDEQSTRWYKTAASKRRKTIEKEVTVKNRLSYKPL